MSLRHPPRLFLASDFARQAVKSIDKASVRIALVATTFRADDEQSTAIIDALCRAGDRGVIVSVCADTFTYLEPKEFALRSPKQHPARAFRAVKIARQLKKHKVSFHWLGRLSNFSFAGRTHSKWLITDDTVYSFGGVNIDSESFRNNDYMIRLTNRELAEQLFTQHLRMLRADLSGHALRHHTLKIDNQSTALIDGGLIGDSVIYRRACDLANQATTITLVSQYCPTGKLNRILRSKGATLYFNHWRNAAWVNKVIIQIGMTLTHQQSLYSHNRYLHAKFILFTMPGGKKIAITGSHNFMFGSVILGTREVALETSDPVIIKQLEHFLTTQVM